jgi:probable lipoprotein LpqN
MRTWALTGAAAAATALAVVLSGCGSDSKTASSSSAAPTTSNVAPTTAPPTAGSNPTIADYIKQNGITETGIKMGDPNAPTVNLPVPDGWRALSQEDAPDYAYEAVVYSGPEFESDPPNIVALMSKLSGNVDPQKIIELAPGELKNLPDYKPSNEGQASTLGDHPAYVLGGTYTRDGTVRFIAQKTVVIPAPDGLYVLQLNVDGPNEAGDVLGAATDKIDSDTTIG